MYGPDTYFRYVCTVTLTLKIWNYLKVMTHSGIMDNNCVKYYPDWTIGYPIFFEQIINHFINQMHQLNIK